jgi:hypothetical protein
MREERPRSARRVRWTPRLLLLTLLLLPLFPGCKGYDTPWGGDSDPDDPLTGGRGAVPAQPTPLPPQPQPQPPPGFTQPANPAPSSPVGWGPSSTGTAPPTTTAGAATAGTRPGDAAADPRYGGLPQGQSADGSGGWSRPAASVSTGSGAPASPVSDVRQAGGVQNVESLDHAFSLLDSYGMNWFKLTQDGTNGSTFEFEGQISNKENPKLVTYIEGKGPTRLAAVQAAIDQLNQKQPVK